MSHETSNSNIQAEIARTISSIGDAKVEKVKAAWVNVFDMNTRPMYDDWENLLSDIVNNRD